MKGRLGLVLCGILLMTAPVWADKGPDSLKDSGNGGASGYAAGGLNLGGTSSVGIHADGIGVESGKFSYSAATNFVRASRDNEIAGIQIIPAMAEPGALPLVLLGLVGVGFLVRRRGEQAKI